MTSSSITIKRDATPPVLSFGTPSPVPNANGWNKTNLSIPFTRSDALSGLASTSTTSPLVISAEGAAVTGAVVVTDQAGNSATFNSVPRNVDKTAPVVTFANPADGVTYRLLCQDVVADYACTDVSLLSCTAPTPNGELINTRTAGARTFKVTGKDLVNFTTAVTHAFTVESLFNFEGFLGPRESATDVEPRHPGLDRADPLETARRPRRICFAPRLVHIGDRRIIELRERAGSAAQRYGRRSRGFELQPIYRGLHVQLADQLELDGLPQAHHQAARQHAARATLQVSVEWMNRPSSRKLATWRATSPDISMPMWLTGSAR